MCPASHRPPSGVKRRCAGDERRRPSLEPVAADPVQLRRHWSSAAQTAPSGAAASSPGGRGTSKRVSAPSGATRPIVPPVSGSRPRTTATRRRGPAARTGSSRASSRTLGTGRRARVVTSRPQPRSATTSRPSGLAASVGRLAVQQLDRAGRKVERRAGLTAPSPPRAAKPPIASVSTSAPSGVEVAAPVARRVRRAPSRHRARRRRPRPSGAPSWSSLEDPHAAVRARLPAGRGRRLLGGGPAGASGGPRRRRPPRRRCGR